MFNLQGSEIIFILLLALVVLGPEKLPSAIRRFTQTYNELRKMGTSFQTELRSSLDEPMREMRETADLIRQNADPTKLLDDDVVQTVEAERAAERELAAREVIDEPEAASTPDAGTPEVVDEWADPIDDEPGADDPAPTAEDDTPDVEAAAMDVETATADVQTVATDAGAATADAHTAGGETDPGDGQVSSSDEQATNGDQPRPAARREPTFTSAAPTGKKVNGSARDEADVPAAVDDAAMEEERSA